MDQIHTYFLLIILVVSLFILFKPDEFLISDISPEFPEKCPLLIDPQTNQPKEITTPQGTQLFQKYLLFYLQDYLKKTQDDWNYITPQQFQAMSQHKKDEYFILDVRKPEDYHKQHLPNSTNIFWLDLLQSHHLNQLPKEQPILLVCYVGHTASQILVLLKLLGFRNTKVLKFGMGISPDPNVPIAGLTQMTT